MNEEKREIRGERERMRRENEELRKNEGRKRERRRAKRGPGNTLLELLLSAIRLALGLIYARTMGGAPGPPPQRRPCAAASATLMRRQRIPCVPGRLFSFVLRSTGRFCFAQVRPIAQVACSHV